MSSDAERRAERAAELEMMLIREAASLAVMFLVLALMHPRTQMWAAAQKQRFRRRRRRARELEAQIIAEFRAELSRDLPLIERGQADL